MLSVLSVHGTFFFLTKKQWYLILVLLNPDISCLANITDQDQLASEEANCSGSALFVIKNVNLYQRNGSSKKWKLEVGAASWFIQHDKV